MSRLTAILSVIALAFMFSAAARSTAPQKKDKFDRLDGKGHSGVRIDVIEFEGNLEIHAYPSKSIKGLALKVDRENEKKPVLVIGYRFKTNPQKQLVRRAVLGVPLQEPFHVYLDPSHNDYDQFIVSNHQLAQSGLVPFNLDSKLKSLHPEAPSEEPKNGPVTASRVPASVGSGGLQGNLDAPVDPHSGLIHDEDFARTAPSDGYVDEAGTIRPYSW